MNEPASKKEFTDLAARVTKLENDRPPGTNAEIDKRLASLEQSLSSASQQAKGLATREDLKKTRKELEETIEKIVAEVQKLRTALQQRGQAQGGLLRPNPRVEPTAQSSTSEASTLWVLSLRSASAHAQRYGDRGEDRFGVVQSRRHERYSSSIPITSISAILDQTSISHETTPLS